MENKKFEEAESICSWREMKLGYWYYISMEVRGMNKWNKPIAIVTVKLNLGRPPIKLYAPHHFTMGSKVGQTLRSFFMKARFKEHLASFTKNSSMRIDFCKREKKSFSFFVI